MTKAKGVWLCPTELGEVAEATVVTVAQSASKQPAASTSVFGERRSVHPALIVGLGVCCCLLIGLIGLHIYSDDFSLPLPSMSVSVSASQISPEDMEQGYIAHLLTEEGEYIAGNSLNEAPHDMKEEVIHPEEIAPSLTVEEEDLPISAEPEEEVVIPILTDVNDLPTAAPSRAMYEQPILASRSGDNADTGEITVGEETFRYRRRLYLESTAYTWTGNRTATGTWPRVPAIDHPGTVAVDPLIIPLGSRLYVDGYGFAIAEDTGGLINGNIIDVYFDTRDECIIWGRKRGVTVYILE